MLPGWEKMGMGGEDGEGVKVGHSGQLNGGKESERSVRSGARAERAASATEELRVRRLAEVGRPEDARERADRETCVVPTRLRGDGEGRAPGYMCAQGVRADSLLNRFISAFGSVPSLSSLILLLFFFLFLMYNAVQTISLLFA